jgi:hypothetical protein
MHCYQQLFGSPSNGATLLTSYVDTFCETVADGEAFMSLLKSESKSKATSAPGGRQVTSAAAKVS